MLQDYRQILKTKLSERCGKNSNYSLRAFARDLGISAQRLSHILSGRHGLSTEAAAEIALKLGMSDQESTIFCMLVQKNHARSKILKDNAEEKLKEIKESYKDLNLDHFKIISDWYHFAIMELTQVENFKNNPRWIARSLGIKEMEVKIAIERLLRLELLEFDKEKNLKITGQFFADPKGTPSEALRIFHRQLMKKAIDSLDLQSLIEREMSSTILAINIEDLPQAKKDLKEFRETFDKRYSKATKKNKVYCLGMQLFNLQDKN